MPLLFVRNDIVNMECDAIVNAANTSLMGGLGVDGAIHKAAGPELLEECATLGGCPTGEAKITSGYNLPAKYIIHTPGPVYRGGDRGEEILLRSCYRNSLNLAKEHNIETIAFPLISSGAYHYPKNEALRVAIDEISAFLFDNDMTVYLVIFDPASFDISKKLTSKIDSYINDKYVEDKKTEVYEYAPKRRRRRDELLGSAFHVKPCTHKDAKEEESAHFSVCQEEFIDDYEDIILENEEESGFPLFAGAKVVPGFTPDWFEENSLTLDESFTEMLFRIIDKKGLKDPEVYHKANIDRKLFSKIRNEKYRPSKMTVLALGIALELSLDEMESLLKKAGYALSDSYQADAIIKMCIENKYYDVVEINIALSSRDLPQLA